MGFQAHTTMTVPSQIRCIFFYSIYSLIENHLQVAFPTNHEIAHCQYLYESVTFFFYAPNFEKVGSILLSACPCVRPSVRSKRNLKLGF